MDWLRRLLGSTPKAARPEASEDPAGAVDPNQVEDDEAIEGDDLVIELPITDALDLHPFRPAETADVLRDYLDAAIEQGLREVRIIHGRGIGTQRTIVRKVLSRDPRVTTFADAPADRGGWGATVAELTRDPPPEPCSGAGEQ
jgi:dsDNA-specific endonuclease/ATPase MutS2